ncbi:MAG TPA: hypothetical protein VGR62_11630 [Candidatus Binatia bacterium]|nr:hypothetical protein [Candidatus Binatia bacterium]
MRVAILLLLVVASTAPAQTAWLDRVDDALSWRSPGGLVRARMSGLADLEGWYVDQRPPGLVFGDDQSFVNPRLTVFLDAWVGDQLYAFVQTRVDRGFDPREAAGADARVDEYLLRWSPLADPRLNVQVGKFATVVGNWVPRHHSWENPFVTAPLPYEDVTTITDGAVPASSNAFLARRTIADRKHDWVPIIWGPSYASGAAVFGRLGRFDYAAEVKNAAPSSRPQEWDLSERSLTEPTANVRLGVRPSTPWALGASFSSGPYLRHGVGRSSHQTLVGTDASFSWRKLEVWGELFANRFEVPLGTRTKDADTLAYYLEARYRHGPNLFTGVRWNQQLYGDVDDVTWDRDAWRVDTVVGWRFDRHWQVKLQYAFTKQVGPLQQGQQLVVGQVTLRF